MSKAVELDLVITGKENAPVLFFIHGWPDSSKMWEAQTQHFERTHRCVAVSMPLYDADASAFGSYSSFGYNFDACADSLAAAIKKVSPNAPVTVVMHDFGSYWGFNLQSKYPELVSNIINFDIGFFHLEGSGSLGPALKFGLAYQYVFILVWLLQFIPVVGTAIALWINSRFLSIGAKAAKKHGQYFPNVSEIHPRMNYPYFYLHTNFWLNLLSFGMIRMPVPELSSLAKNRNEAPHCPILFLYGAKKKLMFHDPKWAEALNKRDDGSKSIPIESGHWVMIDEPQASNRHMEEWLQAQTN